MILDTSAVVALLRGEPESELFRQALDQSAHRGISAASVLELAIVMKGAGAELDEFLGLLGVEVLAVDAEHLRWARRGHELYGRDSGSPARLNFGDCLSYGAAMATGRPLLFKGDDFGHTDVAVAAPLPGGSRG